MYVVSILAAEEIYCSRVEELQYHVHRVLERLMQVINYFFPSLSILYNVNILLALECLKFSLDRDDSQRFR